MQVPQIRLQSTFIKTGLSIEEPIQKIEQPAAIQTIEQPAAILSIRTTPSKMLIDQTEARADVDLKSVSRRVQEFADKGYQDWLKGMARRARQGRELMEIHRGGNPIAAHAKQNSEGPQKQFNIGWIPSHFSVKIQYEPAVVNVDVKPQQPKIHTEAQKPVHEYIPGDVNVTVLEENSLDIDFVNVNENETN